VAVGGAGEASDAAEFGLDRLRDISLRWRPRSEGSHIHRLVLVGGGVFGGGTFLLGRSGLFLCDLLGLLGRETRLLGGFRVGLGLGLLRLLGALGGEPHALLFGQPRLLGRGNAGLFGRYLLELQPGKAGVETIGILREEGVERALVADLQRQFVIAAGFGL